MDDRGSSKRGEGNHDSNGNEVKDSGKRGDAAHETASKEVGKKGVGVEEPPASASPSRRSQGVSGVLKQQKMSDSKHVLSTATIPICRVNKNIWILRADSVEYLAGIISECPDEYRR